MSAQGQGSPDSPHFTRRRLGGGSPNNTTHLTIKKEGWPPRESGGGTTQLTRVSQARWWISWRTRAHEVRSLSCQNPKHVAVIRISLCANKKEKSTGEITARVLFDGTNGIDANRRTIMRDQERGPIAANIKRVLREKEKSQYHSFALTADVTEAHRQVPIDPPDWHLLGAQVYPEGGCACINKVGTFGVASASYGWSSVASAVGQLAQYLPDHEAHTWHFLVADDYQLDASGPGIVKPSSRSSSCVRSSEFHCPGRTH